MSDQRHPASDLTELLAELGVDPGDSATSERLAIIRSIGVQAPAEHITDAQVRRAAGIAATVAASDPGGTDMKLTMITRTARAAVAAVALLVATAGAAYAGVLPDTVTDTVSSLAAGVGLGSDATDADGASGPSEEAPESPGAEAASADTTEDSAGEATAGESSDHPRDTEDRTKRSDRPEDREPPVREIPEEIAAVLAAVHDYRAAAHEWKDCVRSSGADAVSDCGPAPTPDAFGLSAEEIAGLHEKLQARLAHSVASLAQKLACIESHIGEPEALRECLGGIAANPRRGGDAPGTSEDGTRRERDERDGADERGDRTDRTDRRAERETRDDTTAPSDRGARERHHTDRELARSGV